ncbi:MAG TPA: ATP-dependent RNA helicase HrpA [Tepidisphaeraceae bacterium]
MEWPDLPVVAAREEIAEAIRHHQVVVVCGETGSGKTTQLPKICLDLGRGQPNQRGGGQIGHTQPRRLAARTVAERIAEELHTPLGQVVGYKIRFTDVSRRDVTRVKLMTDGILLAETRNDRDLRAYDTIIIDEAHERSLNIDFLLGYLKRLLPRRPDLKLILTSATIDPERFSRHFNNAPMIMVSGRTYPVETRYFPLAVDEREVEESLAAGVNPREPLASDGTDPNPESVSRGFTPAATRSSDSTSDADLTEQEGVVNAAQSLIAEGRGDILAFLPTERDIRETAEALVAANVNADVLPLFGRLSAADQLKVFRPDGKRRRIVLATNVAETSVTVPGIHCVIDTGLARMSRYSSRTKVQRLPIEPVSQASADQRQGRCGRVAPGVCVRLYSEKDYSERPRYTEPEILRTNLASVILQMIWLRLGRIEDFPFIDPPDGRQIRDGLATLHEIGAIDEEYNLTPIGQRLARLPVDPRVGRMIVGGQDEDCVEDVLVIAAALSTQDVRERPSDQQDAADQSHAKFRDEQSDFITILKLWRALRQKQAELSSSAFRRWCRANFVSYLRFREWTDVHAQLRELGDNVVGHARRPRNADRSQAIRPVAQDVDPFPPPVRDAVHRALLGGLLGNIAFKADQASYTGARGTKLGVWPGSTLFKSRPPWIMSAELIETTRLYARTVAPIKPEWIERAAKHLVKRSYTDPHWVKQNAHVHAFEKVMLYGLILVPRRSVHYGPVDPVQSRQIFIHHALVLGEMGTDHPAILANRQRIAEISRWQEKLRRRDLLSDGDTRFAFFDKVVPPQVFSGPTFTAWTRRGQGSNSHELEMTDEALFRAGVLADLSGSLSRYGRERARVRAADEGPQSAVAGLTFDAAPSKPSPQPSPGHTGRGSEEVAAVREWMNADFPDTFTVAGVKLPLEYHFEPGEDHDGVTLVVPLTLLPQVRDERAEWLVPGLVQAKIDTLIRSLPKRLRTLFVPVNETATTVANRLGSFGIGSFDDQVAGILWKLRGEAVTRADFQAENIPPNLRLNVRVIDSAGVKLAEGRDLAELRAKLNQQVAESITSLADARFNRDDLKRWDFGDLPSRVEVDQNGIKLYGYPALVETGDKVALRLLDSQQTADRLMPFGLRRLFMIETARELKQTLRDLPDLEALRLNYRPFGSGDELMEDLAVVTADRAFFTGEAHAPGLPVPSAVVSSAGVRTQAAFAARAGEAWGRLYETSRHLGRLLTDVLNRHRTLVTLLHRDFAPLLVDNVDDMRQQLTRLLPKRFLSVLPGEKLEQLPRYLRGVDVRLTKLTNAGLSRDLTGMNTLRPLQRQYDDRVRAHARRGVVDPALEDYRWLLEELRISLFAQEIKAAVPVSPRRLEEAWKLVRVV